MATISASGAEGPAVVELMWAEWRGLVPAGVVLTWILSVLGVDSVVDLTGQRLLGLFTWVLLLALLSRESTGTRVQVAVVLVFATLVEYCFAAWLGVYVYRLHNVPAFVPPAHGLVYLAALCIGRSALLNRVSRPLVAGTVLIGGVWSLWGVTLAPRRDVLGLFWFGCLLVFLARSRQPVVFVGAFLVVSMIEVVGTALGTWTWSVVDPIMGWVNIGNPPSGAAGGYGWFDAAALILSPVILRLLGCLPQPAGVDSPAPMQSLAVQRTEGQDCDSCDSVATWTDNP